MKYLILIFGAVLIASISVLITFSIGLVELSPLVGLVPSFYWGYWWSENNDRWFK